MQNIRKCQKAGADEIWVISEDTAKLADIETRIGQEPNIHYFTQDSLPAEIEARSELEQTSGDQVRGYTVSVRRTHISETDRELRNDQLARVLRAIG